MVPARVCVGEEFKVKVDATNIGARGGRHVIQVYASRQNSQIERPTRWLVGFAEVEAAAEESRPVEVLLSTRDFAHWQDGWAHEPGIFDLHIGSSVEKIDHTLRFELIDSPQQLSD
jgi:beta-glucosidase